MVLRSAACISDTAASTLRDYFILKKEDDVRFGFTLWVIRWDPAVKICGNWGVPFGNKFKYGHTSQSGKQYGGSIWRNNMADN